MISTINTGAMPVNALLRQQTERQAQQAEQQAKTLEEQAATKRREARQAEATAKRLDAEAAQAAAESSLLKNNLSAAEQTELSAQNNSERLNKAIDEAVNTATPRQDSSTESALSREINNIVAGSINSNRGNSISFVV
ncbi:hypothetical protein GCM10010919_17420 [Alishewanella longhuensis]|uniref:Uncharacterized protein n=1 Tax=Alishewanella longhuensis TaxID=1091037 RepID=A0ABQ3KXM8_9ALTE|nr:hypothetical protein [Alishewanella longhuensis]GHG68175.1 hypothetical protein GCM10010919_17420 [Alishewanella longhuensis]